jgi:hypothetical protein
MKESFPQPQPAAQEIKAEGVAFLNDLEASVYRPKGSSFELDRNPSDISSSISLEKQKEVLGRYFIYASRTGFGPAELFSEVDSLFQHGEGESYEDAKALLWFADNILRHDTGEQSHKPYTQIHAILRERIGEADERYKTDKVYE